MHNLRPAGKAAARTKGTRNDAERGALRSHAERGNEVTAQTLFNQMLVWGLAMALVGAAICFLFFH